MFSALKTKSRKRSPILTRKTHGPGGGNAQRASDGKQRGPRAVFERPILLEQTRRDRSRESPRVFPTSRQRRSELRAGLVRDRRRLRLVASFWRRQSG